MISPALSGRFAGIGRRSSAPLHRGLTDAVLESERRPPGGELVAVLSPDQLDTRQFGVDLAGLLRDGSQACLVGREDGDGDMHVGGAEWFLPVVGTALAGVPQDLGSGSHPLAELWREAVQRRLWHPESHQPVVGEGDRQRGLVGDVASGGGVGDRVQPPHQLASICAVLDAQQQVGADVRRGTLVQRAGLDVVKLQGRALRGGHRSHPPSMVSGAREARAGAGSAAPGRGSGPCPVGWPSRRRRGSWGRDLH